MHRQETLNEFDKDREIVITKDTNILGEPTGAYEFRQRGNYVVAEWDFVKTLLDQGFTVKGELADRARAARHIFGEDVDELASTPEMEDKFGPVMEPCCPCPAEFGPQPTPDDPRIWEGTVEGFFDDAADQIG